TLLAELGPDRLAREAAALETELVRPERSRGAPPQQSEPLLPHLVMPDHHDVRANDVILRRLHGTLAAAADAGPRDFPELLLVPGVGARTVRSLAMVAEVIHGAPCRFADPARFSLAHGGKDRHPFPVPTKVYDKTIGVLKTAVEQAKLGQDEKLGAIRRLDDQARRLERYVSGPSFEAVMAEERARSHEFGGRSVFGHEPPPVGATDGQAGMRAVAT
ncbi:MAG TPA: DUF763 domain-containing protein, partial [Allosphingosinicella sp.]|nr:DUF763 domain-containing protein [Allosphingosinicella sp.]